MGSPGVTSELAMIAVKKIISIIEIAK